MQLCTTRRCTSPSPSLTHKSHPLSPLQFQIPFCQHPDACPVLGPCLSSPLHIRKTCLPSQPQADRLHPMKCIVVSVPSKHPSGLYKIPHISISLLQMLQKVLSMHIHLPFVFAFSLSLYPLGSFGSAVDGNSACLVVARPSNAGLGWAGVQLSQHPKSEAFLCSEHARLQPTVGNGRKRVKP